MQNDNENESKPACERRVVVIVNVPVKIRADLVRTASLDGVALSTAGLEETSTFLRVTYKQAKAKESTVSEKALSKR